MIAEQTLSDRAAATKQPYAFDEPTLLIRVGSFRRSNLQNGSPVAILRQSFAFPRGLTPLELAADQRQSHHTDLPFCWQSHRLFVRAIQRSERSPYEP